MKRSSFFILFVCFSLSAWGQTILQGIVIDWDNGEGLPFALVALYQEGLLIAGTHADLDGKYRIFLEPGTYTVSFSMTGYQTTSIEGVQIIVDQAQVLNAELGSSILLSEVVVIDPSSASGPEIRGGRAISSTYYIDGIKVTSSKETGRSKANNKGRKKRVPESGFNTEDYTVIVENTYHAAKDKPRSTFSIDVDRASYANMRRFIQRGELPPKDAIRVEELINYFSYDYPNPVGEHPFSITTTVADCPWAATHKLLRIGLQGTYIDLQDAPPSNLVFLIDVSGSMTTLNKLTLVKKAFLLLVDQLREQDHIAIVVYAGASGLVLPSTSGKEKEKIRHALSGLEAGGSTAGAAGIQLAYQVAQENFLEKGNNRVILATDGDFNVGPSSDAELIRLIEEKRESGAFLSVLGFGTGNYKDNKMEQLANKGNGQFAYIDGEQEAKKVMISEMGGTLFTIAKDVKLQLEFNPEKVKEYRLIGYENRVLPDEAFNDDTTDAGELGAGHSVTALYEIIPAEAEETLAGNVDPLLYQRTKVTRKAKKSEDWLTVKLRYKQPKGRRSQRLVYPVSSPALSFKETDTDFQFAAAVAAFGMLLRDSEYKGSTTYDKIISWAVAGQGEDTEGYRQAFARLVKQANGIARAGVE